MAVSLPTPGQDPWDVTLNSAITGLDSRVHTLETAGAGKGSSDLYVPVFIFNGESNSGGMARNTDATAAEIAVRSSVKIFDNTGLTSFLDLDIGVNNLVGHDVIPNGSATYHGWELGLANAVEAGQYLDDTVYLIKTGQGASIIAEWGVGHPKGYWTTFLSRVRPALSLIRSQGKVPLIYFWWTLGLNDWVGISTPVATWKPAVEEFFDRVRAELGHVPIFTPTFMPEANMGPSGYADALTAIAASDNMFQIIDATGATVVTLPDANHTYHWDYAGMKTIADRLGSASRNFGQHEGYDHRRIDQIAGGGGIVAPPALPGLVRTPASISFKEGTAGATFTVSLSQAPTANVVVAVAAAGGNVIPTPASLTFTTANWNTAQTVTCTSPDDGAQNGSRSTTVTCSSTGVSAPVTVAVTVTDAFVAQAGAPVNTTPPAITGAFKRAIISPTAIGDVQTCSTGVWTNSPTSYAYQWSRNGTAISGATASTHTIVAADQGTTLTCTVTATNASGSGVATSAGKSIPVGAKTLLPVEWTDLSGAHAVGNQIICDQASGDYLYGGRVTVPLDLTNMNWELVIQYDSQIITDNIVVFIDNDAAGAPYDWYNASGIIGVYHNGATWMEPIYGLDPTQMNPQPPIPSYPFRFKVTNGNSLGYPTYSVYAIGPGTSGPFNAGHGSRPDVLAGKTVGYVKVFFAVPAIGNNVTVWMTQ